MLASDYMSLKKQDFSSWDVQLFKMYLMHQQGHICCHSLQCYSDLWTQLMLHLQGRKKNKPPQAFSCWEQGFNGTILMWTWALRVAPLLTAGCHKLHREKLARASLSSLRTSAMSHEGRMRQLCLFSRWEIELELGHLLRSQRDRKHYSKLLNLRSRLVPSWLYHMKTGVSMFIPQASTVTCYS